MVARGLGTLLLGLTAVALGEPWTRPDTQTRQSTPGGWTPEWDSPERPRGLTPVSEPKLQKASHGHQPGSPGSWRRKRSGTEVCQGANCSESTFDL